MALPPRIVARKIRWQSFGRSGLDQVSIRLDASAYCTADIEALGDTPTTPLSELADVLQPTIFGKKEMQGTPSHGVALFSSSEMLLQSPEPVYFIARRFEPRLRQLLGVAEGTILVSRSGTIGLVTIVTADRDGFLIDDHMIRILPKRESDRGILFTFLSSPIGQQLLDSLAYGAVQKEIKAFQLKNIRVPSLPARAVAQISANVDKANSLRSDSYAIHKSALSQVLASNKLPTLAPLEQMPVVNGRHVNAFICALSTLYDGMSDAMELRLEAHFHNPVARAAIANLQICPSKKRTLGKLTRRLFLCDRFARTYVDEANGIPFLSGKNIVQIRQANPKFISRTQTEGLNDLKLQRGWILLTRSGTVGRTCFVHRNFEEHVATDDIIRIVADENQVDAGYLYAFLSSPYGYEQIMRFRHGSVVDHVTPDQIAKVVVPLPSPTQQKEIGDQVRLVYDRRAEALKLEDEAQQLLMRAIEGNSAKERTYV